MSGCPSEYLELFADGEAVPDAVAAHVESCEACRRHVDSVHSLDHGIRDALAGPSPAWKPVRPRLGFPVRAVAAAAALAIVIGGVVSSLGTSLEDVVAMLSHPDPHVQSQAARMLTRFDPDAVIAALEAVPEPPSADLLAGGWADEDAEVVRDVLVSWTGDDRMRGYAVRELAHVDLVALLQTGDPAAQDYAMRIAWTVGGLRMGVPQVIELMRVPELRQQAVDVLREVSQDDYGPDPDAWRQWWVEHGGGSRTEGDPVLRG